MDMLRPLRLLLLCTALAALCAAGCVERRMVIITDPFPEASDAIVFDEKGQPIGGTPADKPFTYYGKYRFRIVKDGFETLDVEQRVRSPWYEIPPLDFISENVIPFTIRDVRVYTYVMQRPLVRPPDQILQEGEALRNYAKPLGPQNPQPNTPPTILGTPAR